MSGRVELLLVERGGETIALRAADVRVTRRDPRGLIVTFESAAGDAELAADDARVVTIAREALISLPSTISPAIGAVADLGERIVAVLRTKEDG